MTNDRESMGAAQEVCADKSWISSWAVPSLDPLACVAYYSEQHAPGDIAYFQTGSIFSDLRLTSMLLRQHAVRDAEVSLYLDVPAGLAPIVLAATVPKRLTQAGLRMPLDRRLGVLLEHLKELGDEGFDFRVVELAAGDCNVPEDVNVVDEISLRCVADLGSIPTRGSGIDAARVFFDRRNDLRERQRKAVSSVLHTTKTKPRVLFCTMARRWSGAEASMGELVASLSEDVDAIAVVPGNGDVKARFAEMGISTVSPGWDVGPLRDYNREFWSSMISNQAVDIVHIDSFNVPSLTWSAMKHNCLIVQHVRRVMEHLPEEWRLANRVIAISDSVRDRLLQLGLEYRQVDRIYPGVRWTSEFERLPEGLSRRQGRILMVGRICEQKAQHAIIDALPRILEHYPSARLEFCGEVYPDEQGYLLRLRQRIVELNLRGIVTFRGFSRDVWREMRESSVLVLCTRREAFGRVLVEAWLAGLPIVAPRESGPSEIIVDGLNGVLYERENIGELADAVIRVLQEPALAEKLRIAGSERAREFSVERQRLEVLQLYRRISAA